MTMRALKNKLLQLVCLLIAVSFFVPVENSNAIEFKAKGRWQVLFEMGNWFPRYRNFNWQPGNDSFGAWQVFYTHLEFVASENVSGAIDLEIGGIDWGLASYGGALGADGTDIEVANAYIDWMIPQTEAQVRMGIQMMRIPGILAEWGFNAVFGQMMAGTSISTPLYKSNDLNIDGTFFWARPYNDNSSNSSGYTDKNTTHLDNLDVFALTIPVRGQNWKFQPFVLYANIGQYSLTGLTATNEAALTAPRGGLMPLMGNAYGGGYVNSIQRFDHASQLDPWGTGIFAGGFFTYNITDRLSFGLEGAYGSVNMGQIKNYQFVAGGKSDTFDVKRAGWFIGGRIDYRTDWGTPGFLFAYGPGEDDDPHNGSERLPVFNSSWGLTNLAFGGGIAQVSWKVLGHSPSGMATFVAQWKDIPSFIDDMKHTFKFAYILGANSTEMPKKAGIDLRRFDGPHSYLTYNDNAWEIDLNTNYKMYDNFNIILEAAYVRLNLDPDVWDHDTYENMNEDNWKFSLIFEYNF
ncbi:MAG: outer membrane homotrimeric porin [Desulfovibrionaceae bacterium]|nr:outer membrane homotrimeric porin [Desulfovibrionaceae bacterium]